MTTTHSSLNRRTSEPQIALPPPERDLDQDQEWVVVETDDGWKKVRLHEYETMYAIPGLYEKVVYDLMGCRSPNVVADLLKEALKRDGTNARDLVTLDLGAGNGCVAEALRSADVDTFIGVDIIPEAKTAADRDRPGIYADYVIDDLCDLSPENSRLLDTYDFSLLSCVAALGFGDIPVEVFRAAFNRIRNGGWIAFTIKTEFLDREGDPHFSRLIRSLLEGNTLELAARKEFTHRYSLRNTPLTYTAFVGRKRKDA